MTVPAPHPVLLEAANAAREAYLGARSTHTADELAEIVTMGADGTATMRIDTVVEQAVLRATAHTPLNVLSEETGFLDRGSAVTMVTDPLDGSANGAAGVPLTCFSASLATDGEFDHALTCWLDTGHTRFASPEGAWGPTRQHLNPRPPKPLAQAAISLLRPHPGEPGTNPDDTEDPSSAAIASQSAPPAHSPPRTTRSRPRSRSPHTSPHQAAQTAPVCGRPGVALGERDEDFEGVLALFCGGGEVTADGAELFGSGEGVEGSRGPSGGV